MYYYSGGRGTVESSIGKNMYVENMCVEIQSWFSPSTSPILKMELKVIRLSKEALLPVGSKTAFWSLKTFQFSYSIGLLICHWAGLTVSLFFRGKPGWTLVLSVLFIPWFSASMQKGTLQARECECENHRKSLYVPPVPWLSLTTFSSSLVFL